MVTDFDDDGVNRVFWATNASERETKKCGQVLMGLKAIETILRRASQ